MPAVKTEQFSLTNKAGETLAFKAAISVDAAGEFTVNLPEELAATAKALAGTDEWKTLVRVSQARVNWRAQSMQLPHLESFVRAVLKDHLTVDTTQELVILYRYTNDTIAARAADGSLHPNGYRAAAASAQALGQEPSLGSYEWAGNPRLSSNTAPALFGVGVVARVYRKLTHARASCKKVEYSSADLPGSHWDENPMQRLNGFIVRPPLRQEDGGADLRDSTGPVREIPYSDQAADFFSNLMLTMAQMGEQLESFVGDKSNLLSAIERTAPGNVLLPLAPTLKEPM